MDILKYPIKLNTSGACFLCFKGSTSRGRKRKFSDFTSSEHSLRSLCRHLKINLKNVFNDGMTDSQLDNDKENAGGKGVPEVKTILCEDCGKLIETYSELCQFVEVIQMEINDCLENIQKVILAGNSGRSGLHRKVSGDFVVVEGLRAAVLGKSRASTKKAEPRVTLTRLDQPKPIQKEVLRKRKEIEPIPVADKLPQPSPPMSPALLEAPNESQMEDQVEIEMPVPVISNTFSISTSSPMPIASKPSHHFITSQQKAKKTTDNYNCPKCHRQFMFKSNFDLHLEICKEEKTPAKKPRNRNQKNRLKSVQFPCRDCKQKFFTWNDVAEHTLNVHGGKEVKCGVCHASYRPTELRLIETHSRSCWSGRFDCEICKEWMTSALELSGHLIKMHSEKLFPCGNNGCETSFIGKWGLVEHEKKCSFIRPISVTSTGQVISKPKPTVTYAPPPPPPQLLDTGMMQQSLQFVGTTKEIISVSVDSVVPYIPQVPLPFFIQQEELPHQEELCRQYVNCDKELNCGGCHQPYRPSQINLIEHHSRMCWNGLYKCEICKDLNTSRTALELSRHLFHDIHSVKLIYCRNNGCSTSFISKWGLIEHEQKCTFSPLTATSTSQVSTPIYTPPPQIQLQNLNMMPQSFHFVGTSGIVPVSTISYMPQVPMPPQQVEGDSSLVEEIEQFMENQEVSRVGQGVGEEVKTFVMPDQPPILYM